MKSVGSSAVVLMVGAWLVAACGGMAGHAGLGAAAGNGGTAGIGGSAGSARGGIAGRGGSASGGIGGLGGMCQNETPLHKINDTCPMVNTPDGSGTHDTQTSTCSTADEAAACANLECGKPWSPLDENHCFRAACHASSDCGAEQRCVIPLFFGQLDCVPSGYGNLSLDDCECTFGVTGDCGDHGFCLPGADYPPDQDCQTAGKTCYELTQWLDAFALTTGPDQKEDLADAVVACHMKVERALAQCSGGGTGGGAGAAGEAGQAGGAGQVGGGGQAGAGN